MTKRRNQMDAPVPEPTSNSLSIILPARNESETLRQLLPKLKELYAEAEVIVVDDGSEDETAAICKTNNVVLVSHPYSKGNGAAVKSGARVATGQILVFMDADGQHDPAQIAQLLEMLNQGFDMVVGARDRNSQSSFARMFANGIYNNLASWIVGQRIADLTSGFRVAKAAVFRQFLHLLPNGFSYPTTSTMAFFRAGYSVGYLPIRVNKRSGERKSHIRLSRDGARFLLIIFRIGTLYSPLKLFLPMSLFLFTLGVCYYAYTFTTSGRFTNLGGLLFSTSVLVFFMGLVSEQITMLMFTPRERDTNDNKPKS